MKKRLRKVLTWVRRVGLKGKNFTIVSNNCFAGFIYQKFGIEYNTSNINAVNVVINIFRNALFFNMFFT